VANTISNVFIDTFEQSVLHQAQQSRTKLLPYCMVRGQESQNHNWEKLGTSNASVKSTRLQDTPVADTPWGRRVTVAQVIDNGENVENEDEVQMAVQPKSPLVVSMGNSIRRGEDDIILTAATAAALEGDGTTTAVTAGQIVGDYTTPISFDMITEIQEVFMENDIDPDEPKVAIVGPTQVRKLIAPNWLGFTWIASTRTVHPTAPGTDVDCIFMTHRAIGVNMPQPLTAHIGQDPSKSFTWRLYCYEVLGAVRVQDEHLVWAKVKDTLA
jgi:hypothetical protein